MAPVQKMNQENLKKQLKGNIEKKEKKKRELTKYNIFMKDNFNKIYKKNPTLKPKEIMALVAVEWKKEKQPPPKIGVCLLNMLNEEEVFELLEGDMKKEVEKILYGEL